MGTVRDADELHSNRAGRQCKWLWASGEGGGGGGERLASNKFHRARSRSNSLHWPNSPSARQSKCWPVCTTNNLLTCWQEWLICLSRLILKEAYSQAFVRSNSLRKTNATAWSMLHDLATILSDCAYFKSVLLRTNLYVSVYLSTFLSVVWWWWWYGGFWENVRPFIPGLRLFFFFFDLKISSRTLIPLFMLGSVHSGSASWDDCGRMFPDKVVCELVSG